MKHSKILIRFQESSARFGNFFKIILQDELSLVTQKSTTKNVEFSKDISKDEPNLVLQELTTKKK